MLLLLSGCSGAGKNTIIVELLKRNNKLKQLKSCTTRKQRAVETGEIPYYYFSKEEFLDNIKKGLFLESEEVHGNYYGILNSSIDEIIEGKNNFVKDIGVLGRENLMKLIGNKVKIISVFLDVPKDELIKRLKFRGETDKEIEKRMQRYEFENSKKGDFDIIINNKNIDETVEIIENLLK